MSLHPPIRFVNYRGHAVETAPSVEPVTAAELKAFLRDDSLSDSEANDFIEEARNLIEEMTGLAIITQEWRLSLDQWPSARGEWWDGVRQGSIAELHGSQAAIPMPRYPLQSVDAVSVFNEAGTETAVTVADVFDVDTYQKPGRLALKSGAVWPVALRPTDAIQIVYTAGFGDAATDVPAAVKRAVKQVAAYLYANRGDCCDMSAALSAAGGLLNAYKVVRV